MRLKVKSANVAKATRKADAISKAARAAVTMAARRDTRRFVPYLSRALQDTAETQSNLDKGELIYGDGSVTYARAQYYGHPNKSHPETTTQWFEHAKPLYIKTWIKEGQQAAREAVKHG